MSAGVGRDQAQPPVDRVGHAVPHPAHAADAMEEQRVRRIARAVPDDQVTGGSGNVVFASGSRQGHAPSVLGGVGASP